jgi:peptide/nickel transport system ATP-binding protein
MKAMDPNAARNRTLLEVEDLWVRFRLAQGPVDAVRGVSFSVGCEKVGIVGESGSGKTLTGRSILRILPPRAEVGATRIVFDGIDLLRASATQMRELRGRRISMVMQDPKFSLNPTMKAGLQIAETAMLHSRLSRAAARDKTLSMLEAVRIREPLRVFDAYPQELSGGMGQRVMIAMMLIAEPDLLIADEPTSALDVAVQNQVLEIIDHLVSRRQMGLIFISHDLNLVASFCDRVLVMYGGQIVESLRAGELHSALHPYTRGLLAAIPVPGKVRRGERLGSIPGIVPRVEAGFPGCAFRDRCDHATPVCEGAIPTQHAAEGHDYLCRLPPGWWKDVA